jgi:chromate transport protein ChrA
MSRLIDVTLAVALLALAIIVIGPVVATVLLPGWLESADTRDWASMTFFLCVAAVLLVFARGLAFRRTRSVRGVLRSGDWWALTALCVVGTVCVAVAAHWVIALPGLLPIGAAVLMARRRMRQERLVLVDADASDLQRRASFTTGKSSGASPM